MQTGTQHTIISAKNQCIQDCIDFNRTGLETIAYCLQEGGKHSEASHIKLLHDCVEICQTNADFMIRSSDYYLQTGSLCAAICQACADSCLRIEAGDKMMQECADVCRRCAESCVQMSLAESHG